MTEDEKKKEMLESVKHEKGIKTVEVVEDLLEGMFLESIHENYVFELREGMCEYNGRTLNDVLKHLRKYAKKDNGVHLSIMGRFKEAPDMDLPIDKCFAKQEECHRLVAEMGNLITDAAMVMHITQHLGKVAGLRKKVVKFKKKGANDRK